jgi:hypothetical protein
MACTSPVIKMDEEMRADMNAYYDREEARMNAYYDREKASRDAYYEEMIAIIYILLKSPLSFNRRFGCHLLARWFAEPISSTLKMEAICSSETSVETQRTTRRHIHNHRCENLRSYIYILFFEFSFS